MAASWGFRISEHTKVCRDIDEVLNFIHYWIKKENNFQLPQMVLSLKLIQLLFRMI
jgi:NAD-dependent DNA ligase